jgi:hypothetical protein
MACTNLEVVMLETPHFHNATIRETSSQTNTTLMPCTPLRLMVTITDRSPSISFTSLSHLLHTSYTPLTHLLHTFYTSLTHLLHTSHTPLTHLSHIPLTLLCISYSPLTREMQGDWCDVMQCDWCDVMQEPCSKKRNHRWYQLCAVFLYLHTGRRAYIQRHATRTMLKGMHHA